MSKAAVNLASLSRESRRGRPAETSAGSATRTRAPPSRSSPAAGEGWSGATLPPRDATRVSPRPWRPRSAPATPATSGSALRPGTAVEQPRTTDHQNQQNIRSRLRTKLSTNTGREFHRLHGAGHRVPVGGLLRQRPRLDHVVPGVRAGTTTAARAHRRDVQLHRQPVFDRDADRDRPDRHRRELHARFRLHDRDHRGGVRGSAAP